MKYKMAILADSPVQYQVPFYSLLGQQNNIDLIVYYCSDTGPYRPGYKSKDFNVPVKWDIPLFEGYKYKFLRNCSFKPRLSFWGRINPAIISELRRNRFDAVLVHGWWSLTNWFVFWAAPFLKTTIFLRAETPLSHEGLKPRWKIALKRMVFRLVFKKIKAFLYIGKKNKDFYRFYGVPDKKLFFCPYAVDNERFFKEYESLKERKKAIKEAMGIDKESIVILFSGKLVEKKRPLDLLYAYEKIPNYRKALVYMGDGKLRGEIEAYIQEKKLKGVHLIGFKNQTELAQAYAIGDIFVLPSGKGETWGLVVNEAMCFRLPIIVSDLVGSGSDSVHHGENGYIYRTGDIEQLTFYMTDLLNDENKRRRFGQNSAEIVKKYDYQHDVQGVLQAFEAVSHD